MSLVQTERVLVVPTEIFHRIGYFQGFTREIAPYLDELFSPEHTSYRPRSEMEHDPDYKQLIPYVIFQHTDADGEPTVFQYTRGRGRANSDCIASGAWESAGTFRPSMPMVATTSILTKRACGAN
jgi:predicted NUDIX family phosphoesterase